jgi:hypothetical protein
MQYYFIEGADIGYQDMGLFQSKYTALCFVLAIAKKAPPGNRYRLRNADAVVLADIVSGKTPQHEWRK